MLDQVIIEDERINYSYAKLYIDLLMISDSETQALKNLKRQMIQSDLFNIELLNSKIKLINFAIERVVDCINSDEMNQSLSQLGERDENQILSRSRSSKQEVLQSKEEPLTKDSIIDFFVYINLSLKGLSESELRNLCGISMRQSRLILGIFGSLLTNFRGFINIQSEDLIKYVNLMIDPNQESKCYKYIADSLENSVLNVRRLEEQMYAYYMAKEFFPLKHKISSIDNFLLIFQPSLKKEVMKYWRALIEQRYDPVIEYNKSLEAFVMHSQPTNSDLFLIIIQLSRFFKELGDYEGKGVPEFRHPIILNLFVTNNKSKRSSKKGKKILKKSNSKKSKYEGDEKNQTDLGGEGSNFFVKNHLRHNVSDFSFPSDDEDNKETNKIFDQYADKQKKEKLINLLSDIGLLREAKKRDLYLDGFQTKDILKGYETQNVDVQAGLHVRNLAANPFNRCTWSTFNSKSITWRRRGDQSPKQITHSLFTL